MKCKNCGGEIRLEDMYCPYCGSPNEEAHRHAADMQSYRQRFQETRQDVIERAGRQSGRAVRFAAVAILLVAIAANIILQMNSYVIYRVMEDARLKREAPVFKEKIEAYLEDEDYMGFVSFCSNRNLQLYDDPFRDYYVVYRMASNYQRAVMEIMQLLNHSRYSDVDHLLKYASEGIQTFYEDLDPEKYSYYENYDSPFVQKHIEKMKESMETLCIAYLGLTPEEAKSLPDLSRGNRIVLIERGLDYCAKQAKTEDSDQGQAGTDLSETGSTAAASPAP